MGQHTMELGLYRIKRLTDAMRASSVQVIIATLPENVFYLTNGFITMAMDSLLNSDCYVVYNAATKKMVYVVSYADLPTVMEFTGPTAEIFCYGSFRFSSYNESFPHTRVFKRLAKESTENAADALLQAILSCNGKGNILGFDSSKIEISVFNEVVSRLSKSTRIVEGAKIFLEARRIKHPIEIGLIQEATKVTEKSMHAALQQFTVGMTEKDLQYLFEKNLAIAGASKLFCVASANMRSAYADTVNTDLPIRENSILRLDFGCRYKGYSSDLARTVFIGSPNNRVVEMYEALCFGTDAGIKALKPGVPVNKIFDIVVQTIKDNGIHQYRRHHVGHGIGLEAYDLPTISSSDTTIIDNNMTFCIEAPYYELGWGGLQIEHTVAVIDGCASYLDSKESQLILL
jgi:Xaa-Pro aminopeptidase